MILELVGRASNTKGQLIKILKSELIGKHPELKCEGKIRLQ